MYSENKGADQLMVMICALFSHMEKAGFLITWLISYLCFYLEVAIIVVLVACTMIADIIRYIDIYCNMSTFEPHHDNSNNVIFLTAEEIRCI